MKNIQHYIFALISLFFLWWIRGFVPAVWVAIAFCAYLFVNSLGDSVLKSVRMYPNRALRTVEYENIWALRIGTALIWVSLGIVIFAAYLLFQNFGWVSAVGLVIIMAGYGYLRIGR